VPLITCLAFNDFPQAHWRKIWSTNPLERLNGEIKRRANVVWIFPNDASVARLVTAVVLETHDEWAVAERRYLSEESMTKLTNSEKQEAPVGNRRLVRNDVVVGLHATDHLHHSAGLGPPSCPGAKLLFLVWEPFRI
jgi:hypothetical protein